jgi:DNA-binding transcriptional LysR family regulator
MDIKRLRYFVTVAEDLHFGRAAERLHIVQPALSQGIKQLEAELGVQLLDRSNGPVTLTGPGKVLLVEARRTLSQADRALQMTRAAANGVMGRIEIGFVDHAIWSVLPTILRAFREQFPTVDIGLQEMNVESQRRALASGELDVGFLPLPQRDEEFASEVLVETPFLLAMPREHVLARLSSVPLGALANEPFVMFPPSMGTRIQEVVRAACATAGFAPRIAQEGRQMHTIIALVGAGFGVTVVPSWAKSSHPGSVEYRPVRDPLPPYSLLLGYQKSNRQPAVEALLEVARATAAAAHIG